MPCQFRKLSAFVPLFYVMFEFDECYEEQNHQLGVVDDFGSIVPISFTQARFGTRNFD